MFGKRVVKAIVTKLVAGAIAAGCALVAVVALGVTVYHLLLMVFVPAGAGAATAAVFLVIAAAVALRFFGKAQGDSEPEADDDLDDVEDGGLLGRAVHLAAARPVLGGAAALATAFLFLRNPALATLAASLFGETERQRKRRHREERRR